MNKDIHKSCALVHALFETQAKKTPGKIAVIYQQQSISYGELDQKANQLAHYLQQQGVKPNQAVALCLPRSISLLVVIIAVLKAGGVYLPLDASHPMERLLFLLQDNGLPILIIDDAFKAQFDSYTGQQLTLKQLKNTALSYPVTPVDTAIQDDDLAYIIYTSGSTGTPKGVLITHQNVCNYAQWFSEYSDYQSLERIDFSANYIFDMAITNSLVPLMLGLTIVITDDTVKKDARRYLEFLHEQKINLIKITPSYLKILCYEIQHHALPLPDLKILVLGGENLSRSDCAGWLKHYPYHLLINEYGPTETTVAVSMTKINSMNLNLYQKVIPIGKPGANSCFYLLDNNKKPVAAGEQAQLYIGGISLAKGYLHQDQLTQQRFIANPVDVAPERLYQTGDICRQLPDGSFECLGRVDDQVKIRGYRVDLGEIEQRLLSHLAIEEAVVIVSDGYRHEKQLIAYYCLKKSAEVPNHSTLIHYLKQYLTDYMIPAAFVQVTSFPLTANNKLDKQALPRPNFAQLSSYKAPKNDIEAILAVIWQEELGITHVGTVDNFFELGGHSLTGARIITKINQTLQVDLSLQALYHQPTIVALAEKISQQPKKAKPIIASTKHKKTSFLPLSDFQFTLWLSNVFEPKVIKVNMLARKRFQGILNPQSLTTALNELVKKHDILSYHNAKYKPGQYFHQQKPLQLYQKNLQSLSEFNANQQLLASVTALMNHYPWDNSQPVLLAHLFYLTPDSCELQLCVPHCIADDLSLELLFKDLSTAYLECEQKILSTVVAPYQFKDYIFHEKQHADLYFDKNVNFWQDYLQQAQLVTFAKTVVIDDMQAQHQAYSTYLLLAQDLITAMTAYCMDVKISLNDLITAALAQTLSQLTNDCDLKNIVINLVKSTRDDPIYDQVVGCFLRLEPVIINLQPQQNLSELAQQVYQAKIETAPFQQCSSLMKFACIGQFSRKKYQVTAYLLKAMLYLYAWSLPALKLNYKLLMLYTNLMSFNHYEMFVVNLNIWHNFSNSHGLTSPPNLFDLPQKKINIHHSDLLQINKVLDVCFLRDEHQQAYLVISANLDNQFKKQLASTLIGIILAEIKADSHEQMQLA